MQNQIPKNWQKVKLGEVTDFYNGYAFNSRDYKNFSLDALPVFKMGNINIGGGLKLTGKEDHIKLNEGLKRFITQKDDLLMCMTDMKASMNLLGYSARIKEEKFLVNQRVGLIRPKKNINPAFLYYYINLKSYIDELRATARSGVQVNLTTDSIRDSEILYPSIYLQNKIASILSAFDDKIEVNNKIAKTLEEVAQAIFKEWFVKFKFPGYGKAEFVDSKLGNIPKGWEIKRIRDVARIIKGLSYASSEMSSGQDGIPMINLANFGRGGGFIPEGTKYYRGRYRKSDLVKPGDIVIAMTDLTSNREVIGHPARVPSYSHWDKIVISLDVCAIDTENLYKEFLYYLMLRKEFSYLMASSAGGTNVAHLSKSVIETYSFILPERDLIKQFQDFIRPIFSQINKVELENKKLATLRDLLLPKLMKGEIRV